MWIASGAAWSVVGTAGFSAGAADYTSLAIRPNTGAPYLAYKDAANSEKATVTTFTNGAWKPVGSVAPSGAGFSDQSRGFSAGRADYISLAMHPTTGAPYVAYTDYANSGKATVMTFTDGAWSLVGSRGFSAGSTKYTSLAMHPSTGAPYVAYQDGGNSGKATVMTFG